MDYKDELLRLQAMVERRLEQYFHEECPQRRLLEAMRYSLLAGGKRIRPVLVLKFCEAAGGNMEAALPAACGIEMLHTYSLIHDDLPIMDDDDLRRGKPTCHRVFGECTAALAGDALQAEAFRAVLSSPLPDKARARAGLILAEAAGAMGMCGGQELDTADGTERTPESLDTINDLKTGALIKAACLMGVAAAGDAAAPEMEHAAEEYGANLARAFQIRDDILDIVSTDEELGKPVGSDEENEKVTYASLLGVERCEELVRQCSEKAARAVEGAFADAGFFVWLADTLAERKH